MRAICNIAKVVVVGRYCDVYYGGVVGSGGKGDFVLCRYSEPEAMVIEC